jgi:hypothetical protein
MADPKSDEVIAELAALKKRGEELMQRQEKTQKELSDVLAKISRLNDPTVKADALEHR